MFDAIDPLYVFYTTLACVVFIVVDSIHLLTGTAASYRSNVNRRLEQLEKSDNRNAIVMDLRRQRGLSSICGRIAALAWLQQLLTQSGVTLGRDKLAAMAALTAISGMVVGYFWFGMDGAIVGLLLGGIAAPLGVLLKIRNMRRERFTQQFAEALDIIVRSLRAGHPVPTAIRMVAREMPDPIGSEFGMVEDELVYGLDIETAMRNMLYRVGQEDLPLFVTSVAIQSSTGGNLAEILGNLTEVVRQRVRMRRKIRAVSAEGRISAVILTGAPIVMFTVINWMTPHFYGDHWNHPWMIKGLGGAAVWMGIGNLIMRRMVNFKV